MPLRFGLTEISLSTIVNWNRPVPKHIFPCSWKRTYSRRFINLSQSAKETKMKIHRIPSQEWRKLLTLDSASPILKVSARRVLGCHQHSQPPLSDPSEISSSCLFEPAATQLPRFCQWNYMEFEDISVATLVILQELREREKECIEIQGNRQWKLIWYVNQCPLRMIFCGVQIFCKPMDGPNEIKLKSILNCQDVATIHSLIRCYVPMLCWEALDLEPSKSLDPGFGYPAIFFFWNKN